MCEYSGCQEIAVIGELTREHDTVVALISRVKSSIADQRLDDAAASCRQISSLLGPHTVVEEQGLFPEMTDEFPDHIAALRSEHLKIEMILGEAGEGVPDDPAWPSRLLGGLHLLREHILKEQDGVFPAALAALDADQWEHIEAVRTQFGVVSTTSAT